MDEIHLGEITVADLVRVVPDGATTGPMPTTEAANDARTGFAEPSPDEDGLREPTAASARIAGAVSTAGRLSYQLALERNRGRSRRPMAPALA